jgi:acyl carrier protein
MTSLDQQLIAVLQEFFHRDAFEFPPDTFLKDLPGWDSIAHVKLMRILETEFNVRFSVRDMVRMTTIDEIRRILESRLSNAR